MSDQDARATELEPTDSTQPKVQDDEAPEGITKSEHSAILESVNAILTNRARPPAELSTDRRRRSGVGMVAAVNIAAILIVTGAVFGYTRFAPRAAPDVNIFSGSVATTEAAILEQVQEQGERALSEREQQIARIEAELAQLRRTREGNTQTGLSDQDQSDRELELEAALERLNVSAAERLATIEATESQVTFLTEQLTSVYGRIQNSIREQEYETARELVVNAEALIESPSFTSEPALASLSRSVAAANRVLAEVIPLAANDAGRLALLASQVEEIERTVEQADARAGAGELEQAETLYRRALGVLDGTDRAASQLLQLEASRDALQQRQAELEREEQQAAERADELSVALDRANGTAATLRREVRSLQEEIVGLEEELVSAERRYDRTSEENTAEVAALNQRIATLRATIESMRERADRTVRSVRVAAGDLERQLSADETTTEGPDVIDLLGTRVLLRAVVDSPSVREQYPSLYEEMETYFQALARERSRQGQEAAYREASELVEELARRLQINLEAQTPPDSADGYLERVVALVQRSVAEAVED